MRRDTGPLWSAIHRHPFVRGIGDGSISRERFEFYLRQDYIYLIDFSRVLAMAAAKAHDVEGMRFFSSLLEATIHGEMELHRRTCASFGIDPVELERTEPAYVTESYTNVLLRTCYEGRFADIVAVLLPCAAGYVEIGVALREGGLPDQPHCRDWIETYSSTEMKEMTDVLVESMNRFGEAAPAHDRQRWHRLYRTSARYELLFFEMAWTMTSWPDPVP
jgi:thiaminase/transcriptional activator TenA